jgi:hypothetical protein
MKDVAHYISELEGKIQDQHLLNTHISKAAVGWHIEHSLLTLKVIINALKKSNPENYKSTFDIRRQVVMLLGMIPRGKVKAPAAVRPAETFTEASLRQHVLSVREALQSLDRLTPNHFFTHPFLGDFKLKPALKFMKVHTHHHLKIINDIIKSKKGIEKRQQQS